MNVQQSLHAGEGARAGEILGWDPGGGRVRGSGLDARKAPQPSLLPVCGKWTPGPVRRSMRYRVEWQNASGQLDPDVCGRLEGLRWRHPYASKEAFTVFTSHHHQNNTE